MPLLHKKPFIKKKPSHTIKPTDKVFFCEVTEEVFMDYDEFWERLVLLNALVWTCELTGRPNLTYQEALECEKKARKCISNVSLALKKPLLYISTLTKRGRIIDACDDIFVYIRDRYFAGEEVEAIVKNHWYDCKVTKVIMPTKEQISDYQKSLDESESDDEIQCISDSMVNGKSHNDDDDDIIIVRDDHCKSNKVKNNPTSNITEENEEYPPFPTVRYEVIEIEAWDYKEPKVHIVGWDQIRRPKSAFTREKCKLFVKQYMVLGHEGYWKIKDSIAKQFKIREAKYSDIFVGNTPKFEETVLKRNPMQLQEVKKDKKNNNNSKTVKQREEKEKREVKQESQQGIDAKKKRNKKPVMTEEDKEAARKFQLELKEKSKELFRKKLEQKKIETKFKKDVDREISRLMRLYEADWWQKREDLECEDHKDLPTPNSFTCRIPLDYFGDFLMILDFVNTFAKLLELEDVYPDGITFEMLEQAFVTKEVAGVFNDVVQLLLGAIFSLQEEEDEEVVGDTTDMATMNLEQHLESKCLMNAVQIANKAATWSQQYQGVSLQKAPLDALTLTEILRLHILASGATNVANAFWRHVYRGGYKHTDDPGLQFKLYEPEIIKKLSSESLFDLAIEEKIKILTVLVDQIITYASVRDNIEEKVEKLRELSYSYKMYKFAAVRKEKEETNAKKQKIKDIKLKMEKKLIEQRLQGGNTQLDAEKAKTILLEELEEAEVEKETRASYKKREEAEKQERDFIDQIETLTKEMKQFQLGQDRAFRRYWVFNAIPGLYVEDRSDNLGCCMDYPTPVRPVIYPKDNEELRKAIRAQAICNVKIKNKEKEVEKNNSDKENENSFKTPTKTESKMPLLEKNSLLASNSNIAKPKVKDENGKEVSLSPKLEEEEEEEIVDLVCLPEDSEEQNNHIENLEELHSRIFGLCSADSLTCPVHTSNHSRPKWAYYNTAEDLEKIIENLNERGARESELKSNIILNKDKILRSMQRMVSFSFESTQKDEGQNDLKKCLKRNLNFPPDTPVDRILELTLRDMILEIEEKIDNGMLGVLKVPDRDTWRQGLVNGTALLSNTHPDLDWGGRKRINQFKSSLGMDTIEEEVGDSDDFLAKEGSAQAVVIKELAIAILEVAQALDLKYLKDPLAESTKLQKKRRSLEEQLNSKYRNKKAETDGHNEASDEEEENHEVKSSEKLPKNIDNSLRTPFERWEKSLMACTSFSQLFLHLSTLDDSITWKRSAVTKKRCRVCKRQTDSDSMLLCDGCDGGYHMSCLRPKMKSIPEGDWYCDKCKPKIKPKSPRKQRQVCEDVEGEEDEEEEEEEESEDEEEEEEEEREEPDFINLEYCFACGLGGEIVLCDTCPKSFHLECVDLRKIPRGNWSCPFCKDKRTSTSNSKRKSDAGNSSSKKKRLKSMGTDEIDAALQQHSQGESVNGSDDSRSRSRNSKRNLEVMEGEDDSIFHANEVEKLLDKLMLHHDSKPFRKPIYRQDAPDYYEKIKKPMDLRTVKNRYNKNKYSNDVEFIGDILLIFQNTQQYFDEDTVEYKSGLKLSKYFIERVRNSNLHTGGLTDEDLQPPSKRRRRS